METFPHRRNDAFTTKSKLLVVVVVVCFVVIVDVVVDVDDDGSRLIGHNSVCFCTVVSKLPCIILSLLFLL
jgi:hypothetical protein